MRRDRAVSVGCAVRSLAGRDEGRLFIVLSFIDEEYALIADGDLRRVEKPKRKKRRHILVVRESLPGLAEKLQKGESVQNHELRSAILALEREEE